MKTKFYFIILTSAFVILQAISYVLFIRNEKVVYSVIDKTPTRYYNEGPFEWTQKDSKTSNVVGYIGNGAFVFSFPRWFSENWHGRMFNDSKNNYIAFSPNEESNPQKDDFHFSDILIKMSTTTELFNADWLYDNDVRSGDKVLISEIMLNKTEDMRIYHVQLQGTDNVYDYFYMDGNKLTAIVSFQFKRNLPVMVESRIRDFVQSFGNGAEVKG